jgi:hypothetical protein
MTQSYNLSQLANNLNSSGQLDATDGLVNAVPPANGGTGIASYTTGDILYASGTTALAKLSDIATGNALIPGGVSLAPSWGKIGLTTHITGTLGVANGGTGVATIPLNNVVLGNGTSAVQTVAPGTTGNVLTSNGTTWASSAAPPSFAIGQTWQDMTTSRALNTNYTNSTTRPIYVSVRSTRTANSLEMQLTIDGLLVFSSFSLAPVTRNFEGTAVGVVPVGSVYSLVINNASIAGWFELR